MSKNHNVTGIGNGHISAVFLGVVCMRGCIGIVRPSTDWSMIIASVMANLAGLGWTGIPIR